MSSSKSSPALLLDVGAFMGFLSVNAIVMRGRFLPPNAVNPLVHELNLGLPLTVKADRWRKERDVPRLHFIHVVLRAAGLVVEEQGQLLLAPTALAWLAAPRHEQLALLKQAAFANPGFAALWRRHRLPGWPCVAEPMDWAPLLKHIRPGARLPGNRRLAALMPLQLISTDPDAQPRTLALAIQQLLSAFAEQPQSHTAVLEVSVQERGQPSTLLLPLAQHDPATRFMLAQYARPAPEQLLAGTAPLHYQLDPQRVRRRLAEGLPVAQLGAIFEQLLADTLPYGLLTLFKTWEAQTQQLSLHPVTLLETRDPALLTSLLQRRSVSRHVQRTLSPRAVVVQESTVGTLQKRLATLGLPTAAPSTPADLPSARSTPFDPTTLAQLYLAARIVDHLSADLPAAWRAPFAVIEQLRARLSPQQRQQIEQILQAHVAEQPTPQLGQSRAASVLGDLTASPSPALATLVARIETAIATGEAVPIEYHAISTNQRTRRVIEPLRIEWRNQTAYVIAHCQLANNERLFRLDRLRILQ